MNAEPVRKSDLAVACGAFTIVCACLVLAGWAYDLDDLKGLFIQGVPAVPPFSALSLGVLGIVLVLVAARRWEYLAKGLATLVVGIGVFSLLGHLTDLKTPVFLVLFREEVLREIPANAGRPAPQTAFSLCALGFGLLAVGGRTRLSHLISQTCLIAAFAGAWTTLFSFTVNSSEIYRVPWHPASGMSIFAAIVVVVLSTGALALRTDAGIGLVLVSPTLGGRFSRFLLPLTLFLPLMMGLVLRTSDEGGLLPTELTTWAVAVYCLLIAGVAVRMSWLASVYETRLLAAQKERDEVIARLQHTLEEVRRLENDMVRICGWTKMIEDEGRWIPFEQFLTERLHLQVTSAISPEALEKLKKGEKYSIPQK
jgi:hypothetical protein